MRPFLRWVGGKRRLVTEIVSRFPPGWQEHRYVEPFLGSGAVYLSVAREFRGLAPVLADRSLPLVEAWRHADGARAAHYGAGIVDGETYRMHRAAYNSGVLTVEQRASLFVALNHTCFNGLWRVSGAGKMNVPYGKRSPDWQAVRAAVDARPTDDVRCEDFQVVLNDCGAGDLVYLDPPYLATFSDYSEVGFTADDHRRLYRAALAAVDRGAKVVASLPDDPWTRGLWGPFRVDEVTVAHSVAADGSRRQPRVELIARSW